MCRPSRRGAARVLPPSAASRCSDMASASGPFRADDTDRSRPSRLVICRQALRHVKFLPYPEQFYLEVCGLLMAAQLDKILEMSALPNIAVQVLPYQLGAHPAMESNFTIVELRVAKFAST